MCAGHPSGTELSCILVEHGARICDNTIDGTRPLDLLPVSPRQSFHGGNVEAEIDSDSQKAFYWYTIQCCILSQSASFSWQRRQI